MDAYVHDHVTLDNVEDSILSKEEEEEKQEELPNKEQVDSLKDNEDKANFKSILETASNMDEIFSEEQCQNTQDIVTEIENILQEPTSLPLVEAEIEELTDKLPQSSDTLNKNMEDSISNQNIDSLEGFLDIDLIPEEKDATSKTIKSEERTQEPEASKDVDANLLLQRSNVSDAAQTSDYTMDVISALTDRNTVLLENNIEKNDLAETVEDKVVDEAEDILKDKENILCKTVNKNDDTEDLHKEIETTEMEENDLEMDFEETSLESVALTVEEETEIILKDEENIICESVNKNDNVEDLQKEVEESIEMQENELEMDFDETSLDSVALTVEDKINEETENILKDEENVLCETIKKNNDTEDLQKELEENTEKQENELKINFEESSLESMALALEDKAEEAKEDILKDEENIICETTSKNDNTKDSQKEQEESIEMQDNELEIDFEETPLESVALTTEDKVEEEEENILKDEENIIYETVNENDDTEDLQKELEENTEKQENELKINFEESSLESVSLTVDDKLEEEAEDILKDEENIICETVNKNDNVEDLQKELKERSETQEKELEIDSDETLLESEVATTEDKEKTLLESDALTTKDKEKALLETVALAIEEEAENILKDEENILGEMVNKNDDTKDLHMEIEETNEMQEKKLEIDSKETPLESVAATVEDKIKEEGEDILKVEENVNCEAANKNENAENSQKELEETTETQENELQMNVEETVLESVALTAEDKVEEEGENILKDEENVICETVNKSDDTEDLQKELEENTEKQEPELVIDSEESLLESVALTAEDTEKTLLESMALTVEEEEENILKGQENTACEIMNKNDDAEDSQKALEENTEKQETELEMDFEESSLESLNLTVEDKAEDEAEDILKDEKNVVCETVNKNDDKEDLQKEVEATTEMQENELEMDYEETPLESASLTVEEKVEEKAENILKDEEKTTCETINKDDNAENLQKELEESFEMQENELDMDFEETPVESVALTVEEKVEEEAENILKDEENTICETMNENDKAEPLQNELKQNSEMQESELQIDPEETLLESEALTVEDKVEEEAEDIVKDEENIICKPVNKKNDTENLQKELVESTEMQDNKLKMDSEETLLESSALTVEEKVEEEAENILKDEENIICETTSKNDDAKDSQKELEASIKMQENELEIDFEETPLEPVALTTEDKVEEEEESILKDEENIICETVNKNDDTEDLQKELVENTEKQENELVIDFEETPVESVTDLEETESKLELASDQGENDAPTVTETAQPSCEISELESAVKFLQESEEQAIDSPLVLSPKMVETVEHDISKRTDASALFVPDEDICDDASELVVELQDITTDSISISEAEIISEAAKLESEKKIAEQVKMKASMGKSEEGQSKVSDNEEKVKVCEPKDTFDPKSVENAEVKQAPNFEGSKISETIATLSKNVFKASENIPKVSILEERLKEPPKIEIPTADITKASISPTTSKDSLLIQKDAKSIAYPKMLESPKLSEKLSEKLEPKVAETPRKECEKHDFENVGSPRIILKIAKSAITDCGEPRSPKSPKIRSATNSPNPEDSPGQKLGKIKLKLSKGGHPSIISNENIEEAGQWYSEGSSSLSPIGMKIKLSKSGDASIVSSEKHEFADDSKEVKHKFEEGKRTESPIGMKIKLSKTGDASIVQQDSKDMQMKHKDKLDIVQGSPKRTESPIGVKIKLSKSGDASIIQTERQDPSEEHRDSQIRSKEKLEGSYDSPKRTDSPIGMKIKLSKTGDASIVSPDIPEDSKETKTKEKVDSSPEIPKRTESPVGMKIKLAKTKGGASIIPMENPEDTKDKLDIPDTPKRTESPLGMKIKLSKSGDASIVHSESLEESKDAKQKERLESKEKSDSAPEVKLSETPSGMKIKVIKSGETSVVAQDLTEKLEIIQEFPQKVESSIGMKIKLSKFGDASIVSTEKQEQQDELRSLQEMPKRTESPLGMKIKLSKTGDASIIQSEISEDAIKIPRAEEPKAIDPALGMKIKLLKTGDASIVEPEKKEKHQRRREAESPLEMKIKLSKTGHATIVGCENHGELGYKPKETSEQSHGFSQRYKDSVQAAHKEPALKILKTGHSTILQSNRSELTIEPIQMQNKKADNVIEISPKRKDITIAPIEPKKTKLETQLTQILPEVTIQPVTSRDQKQFLFDPKSSAISLQQMNVISQEISITQVRPSKPQDTAMNDKLKDILTKNTGSPINSDCEIIEHRPELIIVNENSNSSQDVVIIEEVSPNRMPEVKVPKKRGRPRRNPVPQATIHPAPHMLMSRDAVSVEEIQMQQPQVPHLEVRENERPKRTCRSQKSYAPPRRGRGRGRGKRKLDTVDLQTIKKPRVDQDLSAIEASTTAVITLDEPSVQQPQESFGKSPELYKALKQPGTETKVSPTGKKTAQKNDAAKIIAQKIEVPKIADVPSSAPVETQSEEPKTTDMGLELSKVMPKPVSLDSKDNAKDKKPTESLPDKIQKIAVKTSSDEKTDKTVENAKPENRETLVPPGHSNWLTPISKRPGESSSTVQVIDEETRMSAESNSRSQTPARNISVPASETIVNEESQGSVLSTATTESEKVKVKNRRMEINFDPDEGPFTVDKIAEYEWPLDRKGETFMIQEQISQYLGVKSFKRKYPDLKRRVVDMEERNYLRENALVSEAMCDMGLTAICSSEVLDVMCSDFPDQYEEYRKHMREKQVKEHSKKQKELTAAANAEKNRIDLAEMAVQSALAWNVSLNKARRETRKCSLDLQTFTIHVPKKQQKTEAERKIGHYPVALIPGQYTDYYREYTPAELRYYPLNTVLYGPMRPNERKFDSQSEGSQSDSDSDSSSDDSSSSSSEGTQDTEGSQSTIDEVDMEIVNQKDEVKLKCKMCLKTLNKHSKNEVLIQCGTCNGHVHPSCIDLTLDMVPHIQSYAWQCTDCKTCAQCHDPADEDKMLFCDMCDRGYHIYCVGLRRVPQGRWHCQECAVCANCGSREPGGMNSDRNSVAQWQHEYKKGDKNTRVYVSTLCVPCSKLWRKGRYCPHCSRCHTAPRLDLEANLVHCSACDKYLHLGCVETKGVLFDRKNYLCDFCAPNRHHVLKPLISKTLKI